jgi:hypothetical protein
MFRWIFSQDTEEIAELLVITIAVFIRELKDKGSEALLDEIKNLGHIKSFRGKSQRFTGDEGGCTFYFDGPLREFFFDIIDRRKIDGSFVSCTRFG